MKKATVDDIMAWKPCGWDREENGENYTRRRVKELFNGRKEMSALDIIKLYPTISAKDILWAVLRPEMLDEKTLRIFAATVSLSVLDNFEDLYPNDNRPRNVIEATYNYASGKITSKEMAQYVSAAASAAASAADSAADSAAAWAAASAADSAAASAAASAADRAAASAAASAAARAADWAADSAKAERELQLICLADIIEEVTVE